MRKLAPQFQTPRATVSTRNPDEALLRSVLSMHAIYRRCSLHAALRQAHSILPSIRRVTVWAQLCGADLSRPRPIVIAGILERSLAVPHSHYSRLQYRTAVRVGLAEPRIAITATSAGAVPSRHPLLLQVIQYSPMVFSCGLVIVCRLCEINRVVLL